LVLAVVPGARTIENAEEVVAEVKDRLGDQPPRLITSDEHPAYATAIETVFGTPVAPEPTSRPGPRPIVPERQTPEDLGISRIIISSWFAIFVLRHPRRPRWVEVG
jgi:hypothetical protein